MENSKIEWTDHTVNLWWGCVEVRPECDNCYARELSYRWGWNEDLKKGIKIWGNDAPRLYQPGAWKAFKRFQKLAEQGQAKTGFGDKLHSVFVGSMMDIFEYPMPLINMEKQPVYYEPLIFKDFTDTYVPMGNYTATTKHVREKYFTEVIPATPNLIHLILTKRPSLIKRYIPSEWFKNPPNNVMFGTSVGSPDSLMMVRQLLQTGPQFRYFISGEPMIAGYSLSEYIFTRYSTERGVISWVIVGGESAKGEHRPFNLDWARELRDECSAAGVPFFFKQVDKVQPIPEDLMIRQFPKF